MKSSFYNIITTCLLIGVLLLGACSGKNEQEKDSDSLLSDNCQLVKDSIDIDLIKKSIEDSLKVQIPRQIKDIEPQIPPYHVVNATLDGDIPDLTITYHIKFDNPLSKPFVNHLKDPSSGWERNQKNGQTIYEKEKSVYKSEADMMDGNTDSLNILVIIPSTNSGYFRTIDF